MTKIRTLFAMPSGVMVPVYEYHGQIRDGYGPTLINVYVTTEDRVE